MQNTTPFEELLKLNNGAVFERIVGIETKIEGLTSKIDASITADELIESVDLDVNQSAKNGTKYIISVSEEIIRLLATPLGSRVMRPEYGSELYKLRDRELSPEWRLMATKYTFVAINNHIERVRCRKVSFELLGDGKVKMQLALEAK